MRMSALVLVLILTLNGGASAQTAPPDKKRAERVVALMNWADKEGKSSRLAKNNTEMLGLGSAGLPVRRKAYQDDATKQVYAVNVVDVGGQQVGVIFWVESLTPLAPAVAWRFNKSGVLEKSAKWRHGAWDVRDRDFARLEETITYLENEREKAAKAKSVTH